MFFHSAKELARRGHKVFTVTQRLRGESDFEIINGIHIYRVGPAISYKGTLPLGIFENLGYILSAIVKGITIIARNKIGIIHSNTYAPALAGTACAAVFRKPHIVTIHDIYCLDKKNLWDLQGFQRNTAGFTYKFGSLIEKIILRLPVTVFHTVSETSKIDILRCNVKRKVIVIPNGIDVGFYDKVVSSNINEHQITYIGRLVFYKNVDTIIKSMEEVVEKFPDSKLLVIGDGSYRKSLERLVRDLGLTNKVIFTGRISHVEKVRMLKESAFVVLPSIYEGFGIVIIEGFACHKPVLVSNVMPLPEIVENGKDGVVIPPFDCKGWAKAITFLFRHRNKVKKMGLHARKKLEQKYALKKVVTNLEELYHQLLINNPNDGLM